MTTKAVENIKPVLSVLVDNSLSIKHFKQEGEVNKVLESIKSNTKLNEKYDVTFFSFSEKLVALDSLEFNKSQTNIYEGIESINKLYENNLGGIVLLSDGNQTIGNDYEFVNSKQAVFPVVLGDTIQYNDVRISQLNVNKYSYIKNKFPVETMLFYDGNESVKTQFSIYQNGKIVYTEKVSFTPQDNTKTIAVNLTSTKEGVQYYTAIVKEIKDEKNTKNNRKSFSVEVIDEQTKVLVLSSFNHPDLGALKKAVNSNKQRAVEFLDVSKKINNLNDYQLVVVYQPNNKFNYLFEEIEKLKLNYLVVSGTKTDWNWLRNKQSLFRKNALNQSENYEAVYNDAFLTFQQENIGFGSLPPLEDKFGELTLSGEHQTLLFQKISGVKTTQPLLATFEKNNQKIAALFGEGIWKWRSSIFRQENSFQNFDSFIGNLVQYLASNKKRKRLEVKAKSLYPANSTISISAFYLDKNFQFDDRAALQLSITNTDTKEVKQLPMSLIHNSYQASIESLVAGSYAYKVSVDGQKLKAYGRFKITDYQVEEQFTNADNKKLQKLANNSKGKLFYTNQDDQLIKNLIENKSFYTIQKSIKKEQNLIDWKWILLLGALLLSMEWFIRKYYGKI